MKTYKAKGNLVRIKRTGRASVICEYEARGRVIAMHVGDLVSQSYSDATPAVIYAYDALGRQTQATDAVGTTVFAYNAYGEQESETVSGLYSKTLTRHRDAYGRDTGYSLDGSRKVTVEYDGDTGRIGRAQMGGGWMSWDYLPGTDLKSSLTYPNGATAAWTYEDDRDLLTRVANTVNGTVTSQYDYTHDLLGRRTAIAKSGSMMAAAENQTYGYNTRDELISGQGLTYAYDDIGNRTAAEGRTYAANSLNQYTAIDTFEPEYDADGNQTRVLTSTGEWTVEYNAENRPVRWTQDGIVITMAYDRMGRRVEYRETRDGAHYMHAKYVYDGYLCVQRLYGATGRVYQAFAWDPTEPVATRPLMLQVPDWGSTLFYAHDGNKNVSEVFYYALGNGIAAHYDYAPFGAVIRTAKSTSVARDILSENPFRFSSEVHDNSLGLVYYNYRHYNPKDGRWIRREPFETISNRKEVYQYCANQVGVRIDILGLRDCIPRFSHAFRITRLSLKDGLGSECAPTLLEVFFSCLENEIGARVTQSLINVSSGMAVAAAEQAISLIDIETQLLTAGRVITQVIITSELSMKWISCCGDDKERVVYPKVAESIFIFKYNPNFQPVYDAMSKLIDDRDTQIDNFEEEVRK